MTTRTILVVDDEPQIRRALVSALEIADTRVLGAASGNEALTLAAAQRPDLVVIDLGLPDIPGLEVCKSIRSWSEVPILVLSARHGDEEKVRLLDAGADDYLTKPFSTIELQARVRALLRRARTEDGQRSLLSAGSLRIDLAARQVTRAGAAVRLTPIEWELLRVLVASAGRTLTHRQLFTKVWAGRSAGDAQQYLRVHVAHLRRKIEDDPVRPRHIITEPGVGYRFAAVTENERA